MRAALAAGMVIGIVACHRAAELKPWPERELGDFSYRIANTQVSGKFTILPDTVTVEAQQRSCRRVGMGMRDGWTHQFVCHGGSTVNVVVDSRRPLLSTWNTTETVKKTVEICTKYGYTTTGQKICTSSRTEEKTETVRNGGLLDVTRIASAEKP